jgi:hypothetical protein
MMRMMLEEEHGLSFADFMNGLNLNPKIVWENSRKLIDGGHTHERQEHNPTIAIDFEAGFFHPTVPPLNQPPCYR